MSPGEWIALATLLVGIAGSGIAAYVHTRVKIARLEAQVEALQEMRDDWREFILKLLRQELECDG